MGWKKKLFKIAENELKKVDNAHRVDHSLRVYRNCKEIAKYFENKINLDALYAASLLHDIGYTIKSKNEHSHHSIKLAEKYLKKVGFPMEYWNLVTESIKKHDDFIWVKKHSNEKPKSIEAKIFQDADRLESVGAIGIGRQFTWASKHNKVMFDNKKNWANHLVYGGNISVLHTLKFELEAYKHFNTRAAKIIGKEKYKFVQQFINQFVKEWKN